MARAPRIHLAVHGLTEQVAGGKGAVLRAAGAFAGKLVEHADRASLQQTVRQ
jgi:hypothetical protein